MREVVWSKWASSSDAESGVATPGMQHTRRTTLRARQGAALVASGRGQVGANGWRSTERLKDARPARAAPWRSHESH
jgi:hypothetical protein